MMQTALIIKKEKLTLAGHNFDVFSVVQADSTEGYYGEKGQNFNTEVINQSDEPTAIHWHGLQLPNEQDGVPCVTQDLIKPGESYHYHFPLIQAGTYWMHSHYRNQEVKLLAAPFILHDPLASEDFSEEIVMLLQEIGDTKSHFLLTNRHLLNDPENQHIISPNSSVRLRIINAATDANFFIDLGELTGKLIAVDGEPVVPIEDRNFQVVIGQRLDICLTIGSQMTCYPILAKAAGSNMQTGVILTMPYVDIPVMPDTSRNASGEVNYALELSLQSTTPLSQKKIDREIRCYLGFEISTHEWLINGRKWPDVRPLKVKKGERVSLIFKNQTYRQHPMHLHGHVFQVVDIDGQAIQGACRDTVVVLPKSIVTVIFDANHPGKWMIHCHMTIHKELGMMATLEYE